MTNSTADYFLPRFWLAEMQSVMLLKHLLNAVVICMLWFTDKKNLFALSTL